jgi:hypothetical protein
MWEKDSKRPVLLMTFWASVVFPVNLAEATLAKEADL